MSDTFVINDKLHKGFDDLKIRTGLESNAAVINCALTLFDWAIRQVEDGAKICAQKDDEIREVQMDVFLSRQSTAP